MKPLLRAMNGERLAVPPIWLMRQAGRYLPEYREMRAKARSFLDFCYNPKMSAEATLQPIRRFGFDAAILFSDILVIPDALGQTVSFETGEGPRLTPIETPEDLKCIDLTLNLKKLSPVFETVQRVVEKLPDTTTMIGFCGAPWTVSSYMIAGRGTPDQAPARLFAYHHPDIFQHLIDILVRASIDYLCRQIEAGVEVVQIFDSWAGVLPGREFERWCMKPVEAIVTGVREKFKDFPIIIFSRGAETKVSSVASRMEKITLGLDTSTDLDWVERSFPQNCVTQGNLDPLVLIAGGATLDRAVDRILDYSSRRAHIFNLGHGILPQTPIAHVEQMLGRIRR